MLSAAGPTTTTSVRAGLAAFAAEWGAPPDHVAWTALALGIALLAIAARAVAAPDAKLALAPQVTRRTFLTVCAFAAAALSLGYVALYLRGGPRIIDATSYFLQGRALSEGHLSWSIPEPSASFRGRFLLLREGSPDRIAGIFPPGYPLLLALGFAIGAPMVVGPALAAALALATYGLARELARDARLPAERTEAVARTAALLSIACAALRYHTADTMAHAASALGMTLAMTAALAGRRRAPDGSAVVTGFFLAGLGVGFVAATRLASAVPIACVVGALAIGARPRARALVVLALGVAPGLALLVFAQHAATGDALASTQRAYYAIADGPAGCFRYGFGPGIGCLHEHGDFVRARLGAGLGIVAALGTTARRLRMHLGDVANLELLAPLVLVPIFARASRAVRAATALVVGQILAYAPFYFDGNYPGGGARFFADVLPIEHALLALSLALLWPRVAVPPKAHAALGLALIGFAVHAVRGHLALANRDGGRPMFDPEVVARAGVARGLVFVETDHGFNLGHDPRLAAGGPNAPGIVVARLRGDDHDRLLDDALGHAGAYVYRFDTAGPPVPLTPFATVGELARGPLAAPLSGAGVATAHLDRWLPPPAAAHDGHDTWRFEAEVDWPPLAQTGGWAEPAWMTGTCASDGRALVLHPEDPGHAASSMRIALPVPRAGVWSITPRLVRTGTGGQGAVVLTARARGEIARWAWGASPSPSRSPAPDSRPGGGGPASVARCEDLPPRDLALDPGDAVSIELSIAPAAPGSPAEFAVALDRTTLRVP